MSETVFTIQRLTAGGFLISKLVVKEPIISLDPIFASNTIDACLDLIEEKLCGKK